MKKFIKNKFVVLISCVIIVSILYLIAQKVIDKYSFMVNQDIVSEVDINSKEGGEVRTIDDSDEGGAQSQISENIEEQEGSIPSEETNLILEEVDERIVENKDTQSKIYVYITGEVNVPGVVILNEGSRIVDAINAAGGTTEKANISKVNLVYVLDDGMKINIPNDNDLKSTSDFEYITRNSGDGGNNDYSFEVKEQKRSKDCSIVNINTASQTELETLPGIGPSLALKIINYRKENGKFSSIEKLKEVSGIGESKFEKLKKYITI